jgi:glycosyltransferase involved in cell wall biosynthesis
MKTAYLIDKDSVGGGVEYIRRQIAAHPGDEARVFFSERGECTAAKMNAWGADVIHVNHLKALVQVFYTPFSKPKGKVVFTVHGIHLRKYDFLPCTFANRLKRVLRLALERRLYRKCDRLIALTETDAADIQRLYGPGLPVVVEPNSVDPSEFARPVGNLSYGADEFAFVCIARFDFQKGQDVLLRAIAAVKDDLRRDGKRTLMIGGGPTLPGAKKFASEAGVSDLLEFAGEIPNAGVYMICGKALVAPSRWEGMPYLLLEAIARGRSVIASDCPGNRDVLKGYPNATMFPVEDVDALADLLKSHHAN